MEGRWLIVVVDKGEAGVDEKGSRREMDGAMALRGGQGK